LGGGGAHTCGVTTDDRAYCWGNNGSGELGDGTRISRPRPVAVAGGLLFRQIDGGNNHTCGVTTADKAYCWGFGTVGQVGDGATAAYNVRPVAVAGQRRFDHVNAGYQHTCGVTLAGRGFCWGSNGDGRLGDGTTTTRLRPVRVGNDLILAQVSAGIQHTCAVTPDDRAFCWGSNGTGEVGVIPAGQYPSPVQVVGPM
jgi:alpha-tubulin suppressor-like RCC1 family protein